MWYYKHCRNFMKNAATFALYNLGGKGDWDSICCVSLGAASRV